MTFGTSLSEIRPIDAGLNNANPTRKDALRALLERKPVGPRCVAAAVNGAGTAAPHQTPVGPRCVAAVPSPYNANALPADPKITGRQRKLVSAAEGTAPTVLWLLWNEKALPAREPKTLHLDFVNFVAANAADKPWAKWQEAWVDFTAAAESHPVGPRCVAAEANGAGTAAPYQTPVGPRCVAAAALAPVKPQLPAWRARLAAQRATGAVSVAVAA